MIITVKSDMEKSEKRIPTGLSQVMLWLMVVTGALMVLMRWFKWDLVHILSPFLMPVLELGMWALFLAVILGSAAVAIIGIIRRRLAAVIPACIGILILIALIVIPFTTLTLKVDFNSHLQKREQIVERIETGQIELENRQGLSLLYLEGKDKRLSKGGGLIMVERDRSSTSVFFFTYRGILDNFSGFIYRSDSSCPDSTDFTGDFKQIEKLADHWFWAVSY